MNRSSINTDTSIFLDIFGDYPINRLMDFLMVNEDFDYPMNELASKSGIGYATLKLFWKQLVASKIVVFTRKIGNAKLYKLNTKSESVKQFRKFYWTITKEVTHRMLEKEGVFAKQ